MRTGWQPQVVSMWLLGFVLLSLCAATSSAAPPSTAPATTEPAVRAVDFESRKVYQSSQHPGYSSWVSFFPGERGQWYIGCEEVTRPATPLPRATTQQWYEMSLPNGYDKSGYQMEMVLLESTDDLASWHVISREPARFQHSAGSFAQARTRDGRFLRFVWSAYSLDPTVKPNEIFYESDDDGKTWKKMPTFVDPHFAAFSNRLRTLRDGTLVLAAPLTPRWGKGTDRPIRATMRLDTPNDVQMTLFFSHDQGRTWQGPLPVLGGQNVSETDFVELPSGDLLLINNNIFPHPGRQFIYRDGNRFTPGPLESVHAGKVPETVCLTKDGILIGCMRAGTYSWSDDLGQTWQPLDGIPQRAPESMQMYQPCINVLPDGRIACAGHFGYDDAMGTRDQYVSVHLFHINVLRKTRDTKIDLVRDFDEAGQKWLNRFTLRLTCGGEPLAGKEMEFWYVERYQPGYDSYNAESLEQRMKEGGHLLKVRTDVAGIAHVALPGMENVTNPHLSYQVVARFNADRSDPDDKPAQTMQFTFYENSVVPPAP